jgi:hypothetical protein
MLYSFSSKKWLVVLSVSGSFLLGLLLLALFLGGARLGEAEAELRVRQCLRSEFWQGRLAELRSQNRSLPDKETARRWQEESQGLDRLRLEEIKVRRPLPDIILSSDQPNYVVRVIFSRDGVVQQSRCFWLGWPRFDREISPWFWYFSL